MQVAGSMHREQWRHACMHACVCAATSLAAVRSTLGSRQSSLPFSVLPCSLFVLFVCSNALAFVSFFLYLLLCSLLNRKTHYISRHACMILLTGGSSRDCIYKYIYIPSNILFERNIDATETLFVPPTILLHKRLF